MQVVRPSHQLFFRKREDYIFKDYKKLKKLRREKAMEGRKDVKGIFISEWDTFTYIHVCHNMHML